MNTINVRRERRDRSNIVFPYGLVNSPQSDSERICVDHGEGIMLYSIDGTKYYDVISGLWNNPLGYSRRELILAIQKQAESIASCSLFDYTSSLLEENAGKILSLHDRRFSKICYTCSGSESIDLAIKIARKACANKGLTQKKTIVSLENSYHGTTYGALSVSDSETPFFHEYGPGIGETIRIPAFFQGDSTDSYKSVLNQLSDKQAEIAAVIIEPILLSYNIHFLSKPFLQELSALCMQNNIYLIFDEVATGFFRTGKAFCYQNYDSAPDIVCMSNAINSGYLPLGAVAITEDCARALDDCFQENLLHGSTQSGNPLAIAASNAAIDIYSEMFRINNENENTVKQFAAELDEALHGNSIVENVYSNGFLVQINFMNNYFPAIVRHRSLLRQQGVLTYPSKCGLLMLPMYITKPEEFHAIIEIISGYFN